MSSQESVLPIHPAKDSHANDTHHNSQHNPHEDKTHPKEHVSLDLDPYAAPSVYYGASHHPRKVAKSRTYSAVSTSLSRPSIDSTACSTAPVLTATG